LVRPQPTPPTQPTSRLQLPIGVIELHQVPDHRALQQQFVDKLVWIRPFSRLVYIMPAHIIDEDDLDFLIAKMVEAIGDL
jgi:adenosylmethionine-8-amino-7-oxononanoate aminotransferase